MTDIVVTPRPIGDKVMIGAQINAFETHTVEPGPLEAVQLSLAKNWEWTTADRSDARRVCSLARRRSSS